MEEYSQEHYDNLIQSLVEQTFHHTDKEAKPVVDAFVNEHPEILNEYSMLQLYNF